MAVKISKLWEDTQFQNLTDQAKLLYLYLATNPQIDILGVLPFRVGLIVEILNLKSLPDLRKYTKELVDKKLIEIYSEDSIVYAVVTGHWNTIPKSQSSVNKIVKVYESSALIIKSKFKDRVNSFGNYIKSFEKPTKEVVQEYCNTLGYRINAKEFIDYYDSQSLKYNKNDIWVDGRGREIKDWKSKLRKVWCKLENKIEKPKETPKGLDDFHILFEGKITYPDSWKRGLPHSKNIAVDIKLKEAYEKWKKDS